MWLMSGSMAPHSFGSLLMQAAYPRPPRGVHVETLTEAATPCLAGASPAAYTRAMKLYPFRAIRPAPAHAQRVLSPPYDVVSTAEARAYAEGNAACYFHISRAEIDLPDDADPHGDAVYALAGDALRRFLVEGLLVRDPGETLWVYRLRQGDHVQTGFVGAVSVDDYRAGRIKRHELTRAAKEDDRTRHILACGAQTGPILLACRASAALHDVAERLTAGPPSVEVAGKDAVVHSIWPVPAAELAALEAAFGPLDAFYIADGHHRAASAARARDQLVAQGHGDGPWQRFLAVVFPEDQLRILDYNRVVADLNGNSSAAFLAAVSERFEIGPPGAPAAPEARHSFGMYLDGAWRRLTAKAAIVPERDPIGRLDVAILQDQLLAPILGIGDPRTDERIDFVGGSRGTAELARRVDAHGGGVAFAMYPTSLDELFAVADAGLIMPPKSTWFEPKLGSGLFLNEIG